MATLKQVTTSLVSDGRSDGTVIVTDASAFVVGATVIISTDGDASRSLKVASKGGSRMLLRGMSGEIVDLSRFKAADGATVQQGAQTLAGVAVGAGTAATTTTYDIALPVIGQATRGDQHLNSAPVSGGFIGWVCVTSGLNANGAWAISQTWLLNDTKTANGNVYRCSQGGAGAATGTGPAGTGTGIADGSAKWDYVGTAAVWKTFGLIS